MSLDSQPKLERTPLNADGDFYVEAGTCPWCMAPENQAPELMGFEKPDGCFFRRQPETSTEIDHATLETITRAAKVLGQKVVVRIASEGISQRHS